MLLDKTVIDEDHPQFIGLYEGNKTGSYSVMLMFFIN